MKIAFYCQHVLGIGHFFRSMELCRAFADHEVIFLAGGAPVVAEIPEHVRMVNLPGLMMDDQFQQIFPARPGADLEEVKAARRRLLWAMMEGERPDVLVVELYPFGRKAFRFELDPVLTALREEHLPPCRVICSLRDILVEKSDVEAYERRVVDALNRDFDALWVHADPRVVRLDETFSRLNDIAIPVVYTGFVTPRPRADARGRIFRNLGLSEETSLVVASVGGGKVGGPLLAAVVAAFGRMTGLMRLEIFTGPFLPPEWAEKIAGFSGGRIRVSTFTHDFLSFLAAADLSISMAGYNTCMNVMAAGCPAFLWPFSQNREQRLRAERLAGLGPVRVLTDADLEPLRLSGLMVAALDEAKGRDAPRRRPPLDLDGAAACARWLASWMGSREPAAEGGPS